MVCLIDEDCGRGLMNLSRGRMPAPKTDISYESLRPF